MKRPTTFAIAATAVVVLAAAVISFSRATGQGIDGLISPEDTAWGRVDVLTGADPTPPPCPPCWFRSTIQENFDGVIPPALPPDWLATNAQGPPPVWVTSDSGVPTPPADTPPNAVFIDDPAVVSDKRIDSFSFDFFEGGGVQLTFRHNFNLEASNVDPSLGYDGGVLELSTDGGNTFQYVPPESFLMGGYNRTISTDRGSPIAGLQAWSGNSEGFITTVVGLPNIQKPGRLRWRMASDSTGSGEGWRVDTVNITWCQGQGTPCEATPTVTPTPTPSITPTPTASVTATPSETATPPPPTPTRPPPAPRSRPIPLPRPTPR